MPEIFLAEIKQARERIKSKVNKTPCLYSLPLSRITKKEVFLKLENLQITQSFKVRGSSNKIALLSKEQKERGVVASSTGNHAMGISLAAFRSGVKAIVVVPEIIPLSKIDKIKENKAEVILKGKALDDAIIYAQSLADDKGYIYISSGDDCDIIAGNGSMALEIMEEVPQVEIIVCPIGVGGGISGVSLAAKQTRKDIKIIGVEASGAPSMLESVKANRIVELPSVNTLADGIAVKRPGKLCFEIVKKYVDDIVTVSDEEIKSAIITLARETKVVAEGAGAASVAALLFNRFHIKDNSNLVCIVSGGNIDLSLFQGYIKCC